MAIASLDMPCGSSAGSSRWSGCRMGFAGASCLADRRPCRWRPIGHAGRRHARAASKRQPASIGHPRCRASWLQIALGGGSSPQPVRCGGR